MGVSWFADVGLAQVTVLCLLSLFNQNQRPHCVEGDL